MDVALFLLEYSDGDTALRFLGGILIECDFVRRRKKGWGENGCGGGAAGSL